MSNFISDLAVRLYRIANFAPEHREEPLTELDRPGVAETEAALREALQLWEIIVVDDSADLKRRNTIYSGAKEMAVLYAFTVLRKIAEDCRDAFYCGESIAYKTEFPSGSMTVSATVASSELAKVIIYPVDVVTS